MTDPSDEADASKATDSANPAREARQSVMLSATIERFSKPGITKHRVRDLSASGARIDQAGDLPAGATVLVSVGILEAVGATVMWAEGGSAGLRFAEPINPDDARAKVAVGGLGSSSPATIAPTAGWMRDAGDRYRK